LKPGSAILMTSVNGVDLSSDPKVADRAQPMKQKMMRRKFSVP